MKFLVRFSVLLLLIASLTFAGCILGDDDDDDYVPATGVIKLSAVIDAPAGSTFGAMRGAVAGDLRAAKSSKFKAVIKINNTKIAAAELEEVSNTQLKLEETPVTANTGKQQVTVEVVTATDDEKPVLKTIVTADVTAGTEVEKKDTPVNTTTTAQAVAYEQWDGKTTKTIEDFVTTADSTKITELETQIKTTLGTTIDGSKDLTDTAITTKAEEVAVATPVPTETTPVPLTTEETVKAVYNLWLQALASATQRLTPDAAAAAKIDDIHDADFMWDGFNKTTWTGLMKAPPADFFGIRINSFSGNTNLTKIDDSTYVVTFNGTIAGLDKAGNSYSTAIDGTKNAFALTGAANQTAFSMTGTVTHTWSSVIVKKGTDGTWRINGNRVKASSYLELVIAGKWIDGSTGSGGINADLYKGSQTISSAIVSGGVLDATGTINLTAKPDETDKWGWAGGPNYSYIQMPAGQTIAANQEYVFTVTFADGSQTYTYKVPALPTSYSAPTITLTSPAPGQLNAEWTAEPSTSLSEYYVGINYVDGPGGSIGNEVYSGSIFSASQNRLQLTGLNEGQRVRVEVNVKTQNGFCKRTNTELQIASKNRFSGNYRFFSYGAYAPARWLTVSNMTVSGTNLTWQDVLNSNGTLENGGGAISETDGLVTIASDHRAAVSPSGNYIAIHNFSSDPAVGIGVKLPTNATNALLNGDYRYYSIEETVDTNGGNPRYPKFTVEVLRFYGNGNAISGVSQILNENNKAANEAFTYSVAADGRVTLPGDANNYFQVSADGNVMITAEYGTDYREFGIAVKIGSGLSTADLPSRCVTLDHTSNAGTPYSLSNSYLGTISNGAISYTNGESETGAVSDESGNITVTSEGIADTTSTDAALWISLSPDKELFVDIGKNTVGDNKHWFSFSVKR